MSTPSQELETYLIELRQGGASDATVQNNNGYCKSYLKFCESTNPAFAVRDITTESVQAFTESLWERKFTEKTITSMVGGVIKWCRWLAAHEKASSSFKDLKASALLTVVREGKPLRR